MTGSRFVAGSARCLWVRERKEERERWEGRRDRLGSREARRSQALLAVFKFEGSVSHALSNNKVTRCVDLALRRQV